MNAYVRKMLLMQGFRQGDVESVPHIGGLARWTPLACATAGTVGIWLQGVLPLSGVLCPCIITSIAGLWLGSGWFFILLGLLTLTGGLSARSLYDRLYNLTLRHLLRTPPVPPHGAPRKFGCAIGGMMYILSGTGFLINNTWLAFIPAVVMILFATIAGLTQWCFASTLYAWLFRPAPATPPSLNGDLDATLRGLSGILRRYYTAPAHTPVVQYQTRDSLYREFHQPAPPETGLGMTAVLNDFETRVLPRSMRNWHPLSLNQMFAGAPPETVAADCLTSMLNPTLSTWEAAPAATIIERDITEWMASLLGLPSGSSGIIVPGGSMANILALAVARDRILNRRAGQDGLAGTPPGAILCSEATHYSLVNAARLLGIGSDGVILIDSGPRLEMKPEAFESALAESARRGRTPFALVLTAGSPVTGGVDPLAKMVELGHRHGLHVHVDAAFGGTLSLTHRRSVLAGIEHADSVTWDAHKWLHMPLPCSALLVPDAKILRDVFETEAGYLFHADGESGQVDDLGRYTPLCGKRFDALKLWLVWRAWGTAEFRRMAESRLDLTAWFHDTLQAAPDFESAYEPVTPLVCFRHTPDIARERRDDLHRWIRDQLRQRGSAFINITHLDGAEQFRVILINPLTTRDDLLALLAEIRKLGRDFIAAP